MKLKNAYAGLIVVAKESRASATGGVESIKKGGIYKVDDVDNFAGGTGELRIVDVNTNETHGWHDAVHFRKVR